MSNLTFSTEVLTEPRRYKGHAHNEALVISKPPRRGVSVAAMPWCTNIFVTIPCFRQTLLDYYSLLHVLTRHLSLLSAAGGSPHERHPSWTPGGYL